VQSSAIQAVGLVRKNTEEDDAQIGHHDQEQGLAGGKAGMKLNMVRVIAIGAQGIVPLQEPPHHSH